MSRALITVLALVALAGISLWLMRLNEPPANHVPAAARHIPDYYLQGYTLTAFDDVGLPRHQMQGRRMVHYADDHTTGVEAPEVVVYRKGRPAWRLRAERGAMAGDGDTVWLRGPVVLDRPAGAGRPITLETRDVRVRPHDQYAETAASVVVRDEAGVITAVGMRATLKEDRVQLLSQVRGEYAPR